MESYFLFRLMSFIFLGIPNFVAHSCGSFILYSMYKKGEQNILPLYIMNLSCSEIAWNITVSIDLLIGYLGSENTKNASVLLFLGTGVVVYLSYVYITINRLLEVVLNIRYIVLWNERKAKTQIAITWVVCHLSGILIVSLTKHSTSQYLKTVRIYYTYFVTPLNIIFLCLVVLAYTFLFVKYRGSLVTPVTVAVTYRPPTIWSTFRRSNFYTVVLLTLSYVVLVVVPSFIITINLNDVAPGKSKMNWLIYDVVVRLSCLVDAWIYISLQPKVRQRLLRMLGGFRFCRRNEVADQRTSVTYIR